MPTNFHISSQPALQCVAGEAYPLSTTERATGFFSRLRVAERLVIHSGPKYSSSRDAQEWKGTCAQLELPAGFRK